MNSKPFNLILLGDPAAGKATQAAWIAKRYGMFDFDMGQELRRPAVRKMFDYEHSTARGKLTPTRIVRGIMCEKITRTNLSKGILFDGFPKMAGEARLLVRQLKKTGRSAPLVIYLHVSAKEAYHRRMKRGRKDDTQEALVNRIAYYRKDVARTVAFFKTIYTFKKISGLGAPKQVAAKIEQEIKKFTRTHGSP
jgi:adenylate kinase family enzyme